jgi:branched-chain amino acid transport system ATP-binding protein
MSHAILQVEGLHKTFGGVQAVADVSFAVSAGEMLALIGPNGAGKSTCFNMLNGQLTPDSGIVRLEGRDIVGLRPRAIWRLGVGRTFQITATFASLSVRENVQMALYSHAGRLRSLLSRFGAAFAAEADALLDQVGMLDQAERTCGVLAYGDLKRVELAIALANEPRLLLMDEPTAGMAPKERVALMELTARLARARNIAVLFTEHDMDVVFSQADRIIVLDRGRADRRRHAAGSPRQSAMCARSISGVRTDVAGRRSARLLRPRPYPARHLARSARRARSSRCSAATAPASRRR